MGLVDLMPSRVSRLMQPMKLRGLVGGEHGEDHRVGRVRGRPDEATSRITIRGLQGISGGGQAVGNVQV